MPALTFVAVAFGAFVYTSVGFGISLVAAPFLVTTLGALDGIRASLILATVLGLSMIPLARGRVRIPEGISLLAPALLLSPALAWVARRTNGDVLTALAGFLTLCAVAVLLRGGTFPWAAGRAGAVGAGSVSAAMNVFASIGGPPVVVYALNAGWPADERRSTMQMVFLGQNVVALASLGLVGVPLLYVAALPVGGIGGLVAGRYLSESILRRMAMALAAAGGVLALVRGLVR